MSSSSHPRITALWGSMAFLLSATACIPEFDEDLSLVEDTRVLAVRVEPAESEESDEVSVTALIAAPEGQRAFAPEWAYCHAPKPLSELAFDADALEPTKVACSVVISEELARFSSPAADTLIRTELAGALNALVDGTLVGTAAGSASKPAGILDGVTPVASTGSTPAALAADLAAAAAGMEITAEPTRLILILARGTRDDDLLVRDLSATALARVYPEHSALRRLAPRSGRKPSKGKARTSLLVHGTFAKNQTWWQPGGDFHGYVLANVLHCADHIFSKFSRISMNKISIPRRALLH